MQNIQKLITAILNNESPDTISHNIKGFIHNQDNKISAEGSIPKTKLSSFQKIKAISQFFIGGTSKEAKRFNTFNDSLNKQVASALLIEPQILPDNQSISDLYHYSLPHFNSIEFRFIQKYVKLLPSKIDTIFLFSTLRRGGAELEALNIANAILRKSQKRILFLFTDPISIEAKDWIPDYKKLFIIDFQEVEPKLTQNQRVNLLSHILSTTSARRVINCNSNIGWITYQKYGKSLCQLLSLDAMLFCYDFDVNKKKAGYSINFIRETIPYIDRILVDNQFFVNQLFFDFGFENSKKRQFVVLRHPHQIKTKVNTEFIVERYKLPKISILWASRISEQKNPELLIKIANNLPEIKFHIWGRGNLKKHIPKSLKKLPENIFSHGEYKSINEIPLFEYQLFLYTSKYDGIPNILLDMGAMGMPIVASNVGGVREILNKKNAWLVDDHENAIAYTETIKRILSNPDTIEKKVKELKKDIEGNHGLLQFEKKLTDLAYL